MELVEESKTFEMTLEDSLGHEKLQDMVNVHTGVMLQIGWLLERQELLPDGMGYRVKYTKYS